MLLQRKRYNYLPGSNTNSNKNASINVTNGTSFPHSQSAQASKVKSKQNSLATSQVQNNRSNK